MSYGWRAWSMFGGGALFGLLAGAVLYAPPELGDQPPPWEHSAREQSAPAPLAAAAPEPVAAASAPAAVAQAPVIEPAAASALSVALAPEPQAAASAPQPVKVAKKRKVQKIEEPAIDTSVLGSGPAPEMARVEPEAFRPPAEYAPPSTGGEAVDPSR